LVNVDWITFVLKLVLVPIFIGAVSLAGRHWGSTVGGWLVGLPLTSGPVAFFLSVEQGNIFASVAMQATMMGIISVGVFSLAYARLAARVYWLPSMLGGFGAWIVSTLLLENLNVSLAVGFVIVLVSTAISFLLMPRLKSSRTSRVSPSWEIPARMVSATLLVFLITGVAQMLGPKLTGLIAPFPVYATVLAVFIHRYESAGHAVNLLKGVVVGSVTSTVFLLIVSSRIIEWGVGFAFLSAIGAGLLSHAAVFQFLKFQETHPR
jgi:hypothetical protein